MSRLRDEERRLRHFLRACRKNGRSLTPFGLSRPDIVAYLNEDAIRVDKAGFPGWTAVMREFHAMSGRRSFKPWLEERFGVELTRTDQVRQVVKRMLQEGLPAGTELSDVVAKVERQAAAGRWSEHPTAH